MSDLGTEVVPAGPGEDTPGAEAGVLDTAKRRQILEGARRVFFERGFEAASMNDITRAAGVSKGTIYAYFQSKEDLLAALVGIEKREQAERLFVLDRSEPSVARVLETLGVRLILGMSRPDSVARLRLVVGVAPRFPQIGHAFYEEGPRCATETLGAYLADMAAAGRIAVEDPRRAARQFLDLCLADISRRIIFGFEIAVTEAEARQTVRAALAMFLRAYPETPAAEA